MAVLWPHSLVCATAHLVASVADLRQREPELGKLFSDAVTSDTDLETSPPLVTRRQYWPLLLNDGQSAGFLMSAVEFRTQRDAVAGACWRTAPRSQGTRRPAGAGASASSCALSQAAGGPPCFPGPRTPHPTGKDAIRGVMRVMTMTSQHPFRPYYATLPDAAVQDIQTLMTALQQDL